MKAISTIPLLVFLISEQAESLMRVAGALPGSAGETLMRDQMPVPPGGSTPVQLVDVYPATPDGKVQLWPEPLAQDAPAGLYGWQPDPATEEYPLALISPASEKSISSTLSELRVRPASLYMHVDDAQERGIEEGFNGEVIEGITGNSLTITNAQASDQGQYVVTISDACGSITTEPATLLLVGPPTIVEHPQSQKPCKWAARSPSLSP